MALAIKDEQAEKAAKFDNLMTKFPEQLSALLEKAEENTNFGVVAASSYTPTNTAPNVFRFQDLPAEIRNEIYELALVGSGKLHIGRHKDNTAYSAAYAAWSKNCRRRRQAGWRSKERPAMIWRLGVDPIKTSGRRKVLFSEMCTPSIMYLNKTTYTEARPILYGCNTLVFQNGVALEQFAEMIGSGFQMLTNVEISDLDFRRSRRMSSLKLLADAQPLDKFVVTLSAMSFDTRHQLIQPLTDILSAPGGKVQHDRTCIYREDSDLCTCITNQQLDARINAFVIQAKDNSVLFSQANSLPDKSVEVVTKEFQTWLKEEIRKCWCKRIGRKS